MGENDQKRMITIVLAGNPNVGKSTIFNSLTGMKQHTGNWAGKTVSSVEGIWKADQNIRLIDSPGCYSLESSSPEEEVAREQICQLPSQGVIIVCDGTCLERNLILTLQILSHRKDCILCINLMDEVRRKGISIDTHKLEELLGIRVITTESRKKRENREKLQKAVIELVECQSQESSFKARCYVPELMGSPEFIAIKAAEISAQVVSFSKAVETSRVDKALTNPLIGFPAMAIMLFIVLWITIKGANYPSEWLGNVLFSLENPLYNFFISIGFTVQIAEMLSCGMYRVLAWVVSVMLPPMAIFFPLFTILEDWGFLPRVAFNLDRCFNCCNACGKQALTMCMGLGCNASAVVGCRIVDSKRERLLAMTTNSIMPCNGRFPMLIAVITMFFAPNKTFGGAVALTAVIISAILVTFICTKILSITLLRGRGNSFIMELPPFRRPEFGRVIIRSIFDRTIFVLARAVVVAAPAGIIIWILSNLSIGGINLVTVISDFLEPIGYLMGLDGVILTAFILGIPANEIVLPIAMMIYMSQGTLAEVSDLTFFKELLVENGWNTLTALNMLIFTLMHWPCATTLLSIKKESGSWRWVAVSFLVPLATGTILCIITAGLWRIFL